MAKENSRSDKYPIVFETTDPLNQPIKLLEITQKKVTDKRPQLHGEVGKVIDCIESPDVIAKDKDYPDSTQNYYKEHGDIVFTYKHKIIKVSVDVDNYRVKTYYTTFRVNPKDEIFWTQ